MWLCELVFCDASFLPVEGSDDDDMAQFGLNPTTMLGEGAGDVVKPRRFRYMQDEAIGELTLPRRPGVFFEQPRVTVCTECIRRRKGIGQVRRHIRILHV